jgi:hypothetical protein
MKHYVVIKYGYTSNYDYKGHSNHSSLAQAKTSARSMVRDGYRAIVVDNWQDGNPVVYEATSEFARDSCTPLSVWEREDELAMSGVTSDGGDGE